MPPPWTLRAWPPLLWQANCTSQLRLIHLGTRILPESAPPAGQTIWIGPHHDGDAGVAWDWIELTRGVVALADPMSVVSNLRLLGPHGEVLTWLESARHLNVLVHELPWQDAVYRALDEAQRSAA